MRKRFGPGRVRRKLAEMLATRLGELGHEARTDPENLHPNEGYWRCRGHEADVMPWTGWVEIFQFGKWTSHQVVSWFTMSECITGFDLVREGTRVFELVPKTPTPSRAERGEGR